MPEPRVAFIDESHRHRGAGNYGTVLGAVAIPDQEEAALRSLARQGIPARQLRFHYRNETDQLRHHFIDHVAGGSTSLTLVVASTVVDSARRLEQGRVQTLWPLLAELTRQGVHRLVIESREDRNDRRDRREIEWARAAGVCSTDLSYVHARPLDNSPLWIADALASSASDCFFVGHCPPWTRWRENGHNPIVVQSGP